MKDKKNSAAVWRRVAMIALCAGILLLMLYGGTLIMQQRRRTTQQKIRELYHGSKIELHMDLTKL